MASVIPNFSYYYSTLCHVCKSSDPEKRKQLKRCSGCSMIAYCGRIHQKQHWPVHKKLCKIIQTMMKKSDCHNFFEANELTTSEEWIRLRFKYMTMVELLLERKLFQDEREMFQFPRVCEVCRQANQSILVDCDKCFCASYCCEDHKLKDSKRHALSCSSLDLGCYLNNYFINHMPMPYPKINFPFYETQQEFPGNIELFVETFTESSTDQENIFQKLFSTEILTWSLSLLYTLVTCGISNDSLVVHIVGACEIECSVLETFHVILHWLPNLKKLNLVLIGPEIQNINRQVLTTCDACVNARKTVTTDFYTGLYNDYFPLNSFVKPDVVVAYNCGFHEYEGSDNDTWKASFPYLLNFKDGYLMTTSYTEDEAKRDISRIIQESKCNVQILMDAKSNPFHGKRPCRDWEYDGAGVFYINSYISILRAE